MKKKQKQMIEALRRSGGNIQEASFSAGISRSTHYAWLNKSDIYKKEYEEVIESVIDDVESALMKKIEEGNITAIIFFLKTKGKNRGYTERVEHNFNEDAGIDIVVRYE